MQEVHGRSAWKKCMEEVQEVRTYSGLYWHIAQHVSTHSSVAPVCSDELSKTERTSSHSLPLNGRVCAKCAVSVYRPL